MRSVVEYGPLWHSHSSVLVLETTRNKRRLETVR